MSTGLMTAGHEPSAEVSQQLRDLERQGGGMARFAHVCAGLLLAAFSLGSLISISAAAFFRFLRTPNLPDLISLAVNVLLVIAADVALLYAASVLRVLATAHAPRQEMSVHIATMLGASLLESATYLYLVWTFDRPTTAFLWAIGVTRALGAPLFAAYLSMARPLPVGPRDIRYQAALAAGKGVVRDVTTLAGDPSAPLERKVRIYNAAAVMTPQDRAGFAAIIEAVSEGPTEAHPVRPPEPPRGLPAPAPVEQETEGQTEAFRKRAPIRMISGHAATVQAARRNHSRKPPRIEQLREPAFAALDANPSMSGNDLQKLFHCQTQTANALVRQWKLARRARA